jgi:hypothetical protein
MATAALWSVSLALANGSPLTCCGCHGNAGPRERPADGQPAHILHADQQQRLGMRCRGPEMLYSRLHISCSPDIHAAFCGVVKKN